MNVPQTANTIYAALADDPEALASLQTELKSLALSIATDPASGHEITSSTVNGQSFAGTVNMTKFQRLQMLRWVDACIKNAGPISKLQITTFP